MRRTGRGRCLRISAIAARALAFLCIGLGARIAIRARVGRAPSRSTIAIGARTTGSRRARARLVLGGAFVGGEGGDTIGRREHDLKLIELIPLLVGSVVIGNSPERAQTAARGSHLAFTHGAIDSALG